MGYTITECPNEPDVRAACKQISVPNITRMRGRGLPPGGKWKDYQYGTPMGVAPKFTLYIGKAPYIRLRYIGMRGRKLHLKLLGEQR